MASYIPGKQNLIADAVSRLHQPLKCVEFYEQLCSHTPRPVVDGTMLSNNMSPNSQETSVADCLDPEMAKQLHNEIFQYRLNTFSETTKTTYRTHRNSYLRFCQHMGYLSFPAQPAHICQKPHPFLIILTSLAFCTKNLTCPIL